MTAATIEQQAGTAASKESALKFFAEIGERPRNQEGTPPLKGERGRPKNTSHWRLRQMSFFFFSLETERIPFALMGQAAEEAEKRRSAQSVGRGVVTENVGGGVLPCLRC